MKFTYPVTAAADLDAAAATLHTLKAKGNGKLYLNQSSFILTEAVAAASFTDTEPVLSVEVAGVEVATVTFNVTDGEVLGSKVDLTPEVAAVPLANGVLEYAAGDLIELKIKTQGAGGTTTGEGQFFLVFDEDLG